MSGLPRDMATYVSGVKISSKYPVSVDLAVKTGTKHAQGTFLLFSVPQSRLGLKTQSCPIPDNDVRTGWHSRVCQILCELLLSFSCSIPLLWQAASVCAAWCSNKDNEQLHSFASAGSYYVTGRRSHIPALLCFLFASVFPRHLKTYNILFRTSSVLYYRIGGLRSVCTLFVLWGVSFDCLTTSFGTAVALDKHVTATSGTVNK